MSDAERMSQYESLAAEWKIDDDDFDMYVSFPFSDLEPRIFRPSIYTALMDSFPLYRINDIRQLSFLTEIGSDPDTVYRMGFPQTSFQHSVQVARMVEEVARGNNFTRDRTNTLITAGMLHDIGEPAGRDAVKKVDPDALDEESYWNANRTDTGDTFFKDWNVSPDDVDAIIHNQGTDGEVLDVIDKIAYTIGDVSNLLPSGEIQSYHARAALHEQYPLIHEPPPLPILGYGRTQGENKMIQFIMDNPKLGNIYQDIVVDEENGVSFTNPDRLATLLKVRAHMHKEVYYHPINQGRDLLIANLVEPYYARDGSKPYSPQYLRKLSDKFLMYQLNQLYGNPGLEFFIREWAPEYVSVNSLEEGEQTAQELASSGRHILGIKEVKGFRSGTDFQVIQDGSTLPLKNVRPEDAKEIDAIEAETRGISVIYQTPGRHAKIDQLLDRLAEQKIA